jgi:hypothetical protein
MCSTWVWSYIWREVAGSTYSWINCNNWIR